MKRTNDADAWELVEDLAALFDDAEDFDEMDAADFKDNAGVIWDLRQCARALIKD